jgi:hypothetical protein
MFIAAIIAVPFASRLSRSFELRMTEVTFDQTAQLFLRDCARRKPRLIANEPGPRDAGHYRVLRAQSSSVPNALAALMLEARDLTGGKPHIYFEWTEGNPLANFARFLLFGAGEVAPVTREVAREPSRTAPAVRRPRAVTRGRRRQREAGVAQADGGGVICATRRWLPNGSRKPKSMPYGCTVGSSGRSTPRSLSSAWVLWASSVWKNR